MKRGGVVIAQRSFYTIFPKGGQIIRRLWRRQKKPGSWLASGLDWQKRSCTSRRNDDNPRCVPPVRRRSPRDTREGLLRAATSRSWPGSQAHAARDPRRDTGGATRATVSFLGEEFDPAIADCGYRAPLAPRLARPRWSYPTSLALSILWRRN